MIRNMAIPTAATLHTPIDIYLLVFAVLADTAFEKRANGSTVNDNKKPNINPKMCA